MGYIQHTTDDTFEGDIKSGITLVDFSAEWCGPCRMLTPIIEEVAPQHKAVKFKKLDIDKNQKVASKFQVTSVPTLILYKDGKEINRLIGLRDAKALNQFITSVT